MTRWLLAVMLVLLPACDLDSAGSDTDNIAERCTAILQWSFQEGNAISEHPQYDWYVDNCE